MPPACVRINSNILIVKFKFVMEGVFCTQYALFLSYMGVIKDKLLFKCLFPINLSVLNLQRCQDAAVLEPEIHCGYGELLSSGLPTGSCEMEAAQASGATPNLFALAGSGKRSLWSGKGGAAAQVVSALRRELS